MASVRHGSGGSGGVTSLEPIQKNAGPFPAQFTALKNNIFTFNTTTGWTNQVHVPLSDGYPGNGTTSLTINNNAVMAPNGLLQATSLVEATNNGVHIIWNNQDANWSFLKLGHPIRLAFFAKAGARTRIVAQVQMKNSDGAWEKNASVGYDLAGVQTGYDVVNDAGSPDTTGAWSVTAQSIKSVGGGWCYCTFDATTTLVGTGGHAVNLEVFFFLDNGSGTAARSTSYTGDGASGLSIFWVNVLPVSCYNSFTNVVFFEDFLNNNAIDLNGTLNSGFSFYLRTKWPSMAMTNFNNKNSADTSTSGMSIANSILTWAPPLAVTSNTNWISTAYSNPADTTKALGTTFPLNKPTLFETRSAWGVEAQTSFTIPSFWGQTIEGLTNNPANTSFLEIDFYERGDVSESQLTTSTLNVLTPPTSVTEQDTFVNLNFAGGPPYFPVFHTTSALWIPHTATNANGIGLIMVFTDYGPTTGLGFLWNTSAGNVFGVDNQTLLINIDGPTIHTQNGSLTTWPSYYDWVKVTN